MKYKPGDMIIFNWNGNRGVGMIQSEIIYAGQAAYNVFSYGDYGCGLYGDGVYLGEEIERLLTVDEILILRLEQ